MHKETLLEDGTSPQQRTCEAVADLKTAGRDSRAYAVCTLDGLVGFGRDRETLWRMEIEEEVFGINKMDLNGDGNDEVIVCSRSGHVSRIRILLL